MLRVAFRVNGLQSPAVQLEPLPVLRLDDPIDIDRQNLAVDLLCHLRAVDRFSTSDQPRRIGHVSGATRVHDANCVR